MRRRARRKFALLADLRERVRRLTDERDRQALVLHLNKIIQEHLDPEPMFMAVSSASGP